MDTSKYISLRRTLHQNAEMSEEETKTKEILKNFLSQNSSCEIHDCGCWFYCVKNGGKKKIAFRADMDALPIPESIDCPYGSENKSVSHRCGHDGHSASLAAFACEAESENTLYFIFQHAEETGKGGKECAKLLEKDGIDEVYGFHNLPGMEKGRVYCRKGTFACASMGLELNFIGKKSHAAYPENGINPAYAISQIILALDSLKADFKAMTLITIVEASVGSENYGTSAGEGRLCLTIRGEREEELRVLKERIISLCREKSKNMEFNFKICDPFPETRNDDFCVEKLASVWDDYETLAVPMRWSEDFGWYLKKAKGAFFGIGGGNISALHTEGYDFPDDIIETAVAVFGRLAQ